LQPNSLEALKGNSAVVALEAASNSAPGADTAEPAGQHVIKGREPTHKINLLKDHGHSTFCVISQFAHRLAAHPNFTTIRTDQTGYTPQQSRLAGTTGTE